MPPKETAIAWRANPNDLGDVTSLIDFLEWAREILKMIEDTELRAIYQAQSGGIEFQVTKLKGDDGPIRKIQVGSHTF
jgi:hypothetical protein